jgi:hypothetical protein
MVVSSVAIIALKSSASWECLALMRVGCEPAYEEGNHQHCLSAFGACSKVLHGADLIRLLKFTPEIARRSMIVWTNVVAARPRDLGTAPHGMTLTNAKSHSRREHERNNVMTALAFVLAVGTAQVSFAQAGGGGGSAGGAGGGSAGSGGAGGTGAGGNTGAGGRSLVRHDRRRR